MWVFAQPPYVPASTVVFDFGTRLGGPGRSWSTRDADDLAPIARDEGVPSFGPVSSPEDLAIWSLLDNRTDARAREAKACSLVVSGRLAHGARPLRALAGALPRTSDWLIGMQERAARLADLAGTDLAAAQELLSAWESGTVSALRLGDVV